MKPALLISKRIRSWAWFSVLAPALLLQGGCATISRYEIENLERAVIAALPAGRSVYVYANLLHGGDFVRTAAALSADDFLGMSRLLENADSAYVAAASPASRPDDWTLIAVGNFPAAAYSAALNLDGSWKRVCSAGRLWVSADRDMELAVPSSQIVMAGRPEVQSSVKLLGMQAPLAGVPSDRFYELMLQNPGRDFIAYTLEPENFFPSEFPRDFAFGFTATVLGDFVDDKLKAELFLEFPSAAKARVSALLIRSLIIAQTKKTDARMFENTVVRAEGESVAVRFILIEPQDAIGYLQPVPAEEDEAR